MTKDEIMEYPIRRYEGPVHVIRSKEKLTSAVQQLKKETILGFDTETKPAYQKGRHHPPALLQLAGENDVFVFQLKHLRLPKSLLEILANPNIIKAGVSLDYDISELIKLARFEPAGFVDLGKLAKEIGMKNHGLRGLSAVVLGFRIPKTARKSNWAKDTLTPAQIKYAATDAWIGRELYKKIQQEGSEMKSSAWSSLKVVNLYKPQASGSKLQVTSYRLQAASFKRK
ncbi:3'-5' exonuclease domain-containing protein 2 [bacterium]|nr:3'-5' exonuclease domain-containing protein 2 [bacterium]